NDNTQQRLPDDESANKSQYTSQVLNISQLFVGGIVDNIGYMLLIIISKIFLHQFMYVVLGDKLIEERRNDIFDRFAVIINLFLKLVMQAVYLVKSVFDRGWNLYQRFFNNMLHLLSFYK